MKFGKRSAALFWTIILALGIFSFATASSGATNKPTPTVEDCVERMGLSEEKCTEMIEKFKNMTPEERAKERPQGPPRTGDKNGSPSGVPGRENGASNNFGDIETQIENTQKAKSAREERFSQMEKRMEKIVEYLKSESIDTSEAEENMATFKEKAENVLSAYDEYIAALKDSLNSNDGKPSGTVREAREKIRELSTEMRKFFRDTLLANLRSLVEKLSE